MQDFDKTTRITNSPLAMRLTSNLLVTIFDGDAQPKTIRLDGFRKGNISFGRSDTNDIVLTSPLVSREHGRFSFKNDSGQLKIRRYTVIGQAKTV